MVDRNHYVGPYIVGEYRPEKAKQLVWFCPKNDKHKINANAKFCEHCGSKVENAVTENGKSLRPTSLCGLQLAMGNKLMLVEPIAGVRFGKPNTDYWIPNVLWPCNRDEEDEITEITADLIAEEVNLFAQHFKTEIELIKARDYKKVNIKWGVLAWYD